MIRPRNPLRPALLGKPLDRFLGFFVALHLLTIFVRPQYHLPVLEKVEFPLLLSLLPFGAWLLLGSRTWTWQMKAMALVALEGALWVPVAVNSRHAFEGFRGLLQLFLGIVFPLATLMGYGSQLRRIFRMFFLSLVYLSIFSLKEGGVGPGDFVGDENDLCLVLVMLLPFAALPFLMRTSFLSRIAAFGALLLGLAGIVTTSSRGGFLALGAVLLYFFVWSQQKARLALFVLPLLLLGLPFVPAAYWAQISTITQSDQGSARERRETWNYALDVFLKPSHILAGVGMKNVPIYLGEFKTSENRNLWGRQTHSLYFELLPDLGLVGAVLVFSMILVSCRRNRYVATEALRLHREGRVREPEWLQRELLFVSAAATLANAAWCGVLIGGAFISILYYPPIWILAGVSTAIELYWKKVHRAVESAVENIQSANSAGSASRFTLRRAINAAFP